MRPHHGSRIQKAAKARRKTGTKAEKELTKILTEINNGVLKGKFQREWVFGGKWALDFFFYENRLGIEIDDSYHDSHTQHMKDIEEKRCYDFGITLIRLTDQDIFGNREKLLEKLREGWRRANQRARKRSPRKMS